jgi:hypothetical protein
MIMACVKVITIRTSLWLYYSCDFPQINSCNYEAYCSIVHTFAAAIVHTIDKASDVLSLQFSQSQSQQSYNY